MVKKIIFILIVLGVPLVSAAQPYICDFGGFSTLGSGQSRYISNFTITGGGINKSSGGTDGGYQNYTATVGAVQQGSSYSASISYSACAWGHYLGVYVDWNNNGSYDGGTETVLDYQLNNTASRFYFSS